MTDPRGARLHGPQENELLRDHHGFVALRDLRPSQPRLVVTSGARLPELETAILPVLKGLWVFEVNPTAIRVRFTGTATRRGRTVALFSIQPDPSSLPSNGWSLPYEGCLALEVRTGRLESLDLKATPHLDRRIQPLSGPRITATLTAEYP